MVVASLTNTVAAIMRVIIRATSLLQTSTTRLLLQHLGRASTAVPRLFISYQTAPTSKRTLFNLPKQHIANMSTESTQSQACCNTPAVVSKGYQPKGDYIEVDGLKTCTSNTASPLCNPADFNRPNRSQGRKARNSRRLRHLRIL
jgi:hypothetical protein